MSYERLGLIGRWFAGIAFMLIGGAVAWRSIYWINWQLRPTRPRDVLFPIPLMAILAVLGLGIFVLGMRIVVRFGSRHKSQNSPDTE
jgi:hypothetical protein